MKTRCIGPFGESIEKHLELRRSLGFLLLNAEITLRDFDRYVVDRYPGAKTVTRDVVMGYLQSLKHLQTLTKHRRLSDLRQFCRFLFQINLDTYVPEKGLLPPATTNWKPYLYSLEETKDLIKIAGQLPPQESLRPRTYETLISLLWATGLRIGEAIRLNLEDVDNAVLHIRQSKFFKSRLVPLMNSSASALQNYRDLRLRFGHDQSPNAPFFVNERAKRCVYVTVNHTFLALVRHLGLKNANGSSPGLHSFRHTFATRCLSQAYKSGKDPVVVLPLLATYLGHANISHTQVYLHPSTDTLQDANHLFHQHIGEGQWRGDDERG
jgi:integrase/recombinase XerD